MMRNTLMILLIAVLMAGVVNANPVPTAEFNAETCSVTISPNGNALEAGWFVCITEGEFVGLHHESENVDCGTRVQIGYEMVMDLSEVIDCGIATPTLKTQFGTLKSIYR
jgi:hypothetical protein